MSRSQLRHQFMVFDTPIDSRSALPLTLDEALDDWSQDHRSLDSPSYMLRPRRSERSLCLPAAPPSTRKSSFEFFNYTAHDKAREGSFSSNGSTPSMVEDHPGLSDSDADLHIEHDPYEESMGRIWDTYETLLVQDDSAEAIMFHGVYLPSCLDDLQSPPQLLPSEPMLPHKAPRPQSRAKSRPSRDFQAVQHSFTPAPRCNQSKVKVTPRRYREMDENQLITIADSITGNQASDLNRSHAQRTARHAPNTLKSLPPVPQKRAGRSLQSSPSKRSRSQPPIHPFPHRQHPSYRDLPYHARPAANPCNSSHAYSFHNTPPLPPVEKSAFDCDTDDENNHDPVTPLSSSIASKMHLRGFSLGSKLGLTGKRDGIKYEGPGRRRSATEIMMGVFGLARK
jgi:hypothetical protein